VISSLKTDATSAKSENTAGKDESNKAGSEDTDEPAVNLKESENDVSLIYFI